MGNTEACIPAMRTSSDSTYTRTAGVISASNSGGISDIRVMHEMSQISLNMKRPIPTRDRLLGPQAVVEVNGDLLESLTCMSCGTTEQLHSSLGKVNESQGRCPDCGENRTPNVFHTIGDQSSLLDYTLAELGVPPWDILTGRAGLSQKHYEFSGDRELVLGALALPLDQN
jgi:hypothetical protein